MKRYTDVGGIAAHLRVAESTIRAWVRHLKMPVIRAGRLVRFDVDVAEGWYESGAPAGLAEAMRVDAKRRRDRAGSGAEQVKQRGGRARATTDTIQRSLRGVKP